MKHLSRKIVSIALAVMMVFSAVGLTAFAVDNPIIDTTKAVEFTIHKYDIPEGTKVDGTPIADVLKRGNGQEVTDWTEWGLEAAPAPLAGVVFELYKIGPVGGDTASTETTTTIPSGATPDFTMDATDSSGLSAITIPAAAQGRYLVVEKSAPEKVTTKTPNFLVDLPMTTPEQTDINYDVHVYPKNYTVLGSVVLTKTVEGKNIDNTDLKDGEVALIAKFDLFKADGKEDDGTGNLVTKWTKIDNYTTNDYGEIIINDLLVGDYKFVETEAPGSAGINTTPIYFTISENGKTIYNNRAVVFENEEDADDVDVTGTVIHVTFDNSDLPTIVKDINGGTSAVVSYDEEFTYTLTPQVPADIDSYTKYIVTDELNPALNFVADSVVVKSGSTTLVEDTDYKLDVVDVPASEGVAAHTELKVTFIEGTFTAGQSLNAEEALTIAFKATLNATYVEANNLIGTKIPNDADLIFNNGYLPEDETVTTPEVTVETGGIAYVKVDAADTTKKLAGAEFALYSIAVENGVDVDGSAKIERTVTSNNEGYFEFTGLKYSSATIRYYMVETKAPVDANGKEYELFGEEIDVTISATSYSTTSATPIQVKNTLKPELPFTGGMGTILFTVVGLALMGGAAVMFFLYRKSSKKNEA